MAVAYTTMNEKNLKLFSAFIVKGKKGNPGTIIETTKHELIIATGSDDAIALTEIQPAGKKRMKVTDYLSGVQESLVGKVLL